MADLNRDLARDANKIVIAADAAYRLAEQRTVVRDGIQLLAPTLIRSQLLSLLYQAARRGELTEREAKAQCHVA